MVRERERGVGRKAGGEKKGGRQKGEGGGTEKGRE